MTECKMSKQGWPLGTYRHRLGECYAVEAERLSSLLVKRYGLPFVEIEQLQGDARFSSLYAECRLSMETYGLIRAFVEGFKANR
jgi:hypothetical protein